MILTPKNGGQGGRVPLAGSRDRVPCGVWGKAPRFMTMKKKVLDFINTHSLFDKRKILVGVSGGVDSMSLLHFFLSVKDSENLEVAAVHFEHGIRGEESKEDAAFVKKYCEANNIAFFMGEGDVPKYAEEHKITLEMAARILRYEFFDKMLKNEDFDRLATAHHADDQAETALLNIFRGSGIKGLVAMRPKRDNIIRPFLSVSKREILEYAKLNNIAFREDYTNKSVEYKRNRVRLELLPILETYQPEIKRHLTMLSEIAREENDYLESVAKDKLYLLKNENLNDFKHEPLALQRRIIMLFLEENRILTDFLHIEEIRKLILNGEKGKRIELAKNIFAELSYNGLQIVKDAGKNISTKILNVPGVNILEDYHIKITTELLDKIPIKTYPDEYYSDYDKINGKIGVRTRLDGDYVKLSFGKKSVKKIFMEEKIERSRRNIYPIIFSGTQILWIPKLRRSALYKPNKDSKRILYMKVEEI